MSWQVPFETPTTECNNIKLSLEPRQLQIVYKLGSGTLKIPLPRVTLWPFCEVKIGDLYITEMEQRFQKVVTIDYDSKQVLVDTNNELLDGKVAIVEIAV